jgi:hypothetical protein
MVSESNVGEVAGAIPVRRDCPSGAFPVWIPKWESATYERLTRKYFPRPLPDVADGLVADDRGLTLCDADCEPLLPTVPWRALG